MKKIIILEGIATSGKTTIKEKLSKIFDEKGLKTLVVDENQTLMPILENTEKKAAVDLLNKVIDEALQSDADIIIFDRLYFTHIFRTKSMTADFSTIEDLLSKHNATIILLTVERSTIGNRIFEAMKHRDPTWTAFVKRKGTDKEIIKYYTDQQDQLLELTKQSKLKTIILDVTNNNYDEIAKEMQ